MSERRLINALLSGKPYFGPALCALQGPIVRHKFFSAFVEVVGRTNLGEKISILEVGTWAGASAVSWAKGINKHNRQGQVTCIDPWRPYFDLAIDNEVHYTEMNEAATESSIFQLFLHNIRTAGVSDMISYLVGNSCDILPTLTSETFDIVYIDGSHLYDDVLLDIQLAKKLVRDGGIICGDDLELQRNEIDQQEHFATVQLQKDYVYSSTANRSYHPGVTEAVAAEFGKVSAWEGIWAMKKCDAHWEKLELTVNDLQIPPHILESSALKTVEHITETSAFNLARFGERFVAVAKSLGSLEVLVEHVGERELPPLLFIGKSIEQVRAKAINFEKNYTFPDVKLLHAKNGYNIVAAGDRYIAIARKLGTVHLFRERLGERDLPPYIITAPDISTLQRRLARTIRRFLLGLAG